jgi:hypothetical protein
VFPQIAHNRDIQRRRDGEVIQPVDRTLFQFLESAVKLLVILVHAQIPGQIPQALAEFIPCCRVEEFRRVFLHALT